MVLEGNEFIEKPIENIVPNDKVLIRAGERVPVSEWCVATSFYQRPASHVSFYPLFNLRNLLYLIWDGLQYAVMIRPLFTKKKKRENILRVLSHFLISSNNAAAAAPPSIPL